MTLLAYPLSIFHSFLCNGYGFSVSIPACCFTPLYNIHTKSKNFSSILRTVESILPSLWIKRRADASALPYTSARAQFDTIVLNLTNGESSIQALQEVYCNNLPFLCSFQMMGKEGFLLLDCRISMFETTTSFLKERVQNQDFFLFNTLRKLKSTPHRHCLTVEMLLTWSVLSATSKQCFELSGTSFLVYSLIFVKYKFR